MDGKASMDDGVSSGDFVIFRVRSKVVSMMVVVVWLFSGSDSSRVVFM